jgi:aldehyde:ferredoxin oxidoreductase
MVNDYGYAGRIMRLDLASRTTSTSPTSEYAANFLGGRGIGTKIYWDEIRPEVKALDPDNKLIFTTGPVTGIFPSGSRWQVYGKSPGRVSEGFCYTNLGGHWGARLKCAGLDVLVVEGKSERPAYVFIHDDVAEVRDASHLWHRGSVEVRDALKREIGDKVAVVAIGPAGENGVVFANLLADLDASGSSGFGAVMGSKNLKAIVVSGTKKLEGADPQQLRQLALYIRRAVGKVPRLDPVLELPQAVKHDVCFACIGCDMRSSYQAENGVRGKYACGSGAFYQELARHYYGRWTEVPFTVNRLCDNYGLDIYALATTLTLLLRCAAAGIVSESNLGLSLSKLGSLEFMETLVRKIAYREGFGDLLAQGPIRAAQSLGEQASGLINDVVSDSLGHVLSLDPRLLIYTGLIYAMEPRLSGPQTSEIIGRGGNLWSRWAKQEPGAYLSGEVMRATARKFWGGELAVDFSTYEGKALAAKMVQDREYANDCLTLCQWMFPITDCEFSDDHSGDPTVESQLLSAVLGRRIDEQSLYRIGEKVFNLQRVVMAREGHRGRECDRLPDFLYTKTLKMDYTVHGCLVPGPDGKTISRKGETVDRAKFEKMKNEYYALRGWDVATGLQTRAGLVQIGLKDVADELALQGLVV